MDFAKKLLECLGLNDRLDYVTTALPRISRGAPLMLLRHFLGAPEMILWYSWGTSRIYFNFFIGLKHSWSNIHRFCFLL